MNGAGGPRGPGCGARGWRRGLAGLRDNTSTRRHWCGGHRRDRRARAGFDARRRTTCGRLASRAAGPSGARNTHGATSSPTQRSANGHMKPVPPLQAAIIRNLKPPSPLLAEEAMRIAIAHWRGCHRFQSIQRIGAQRRHQFHSTNVGLVILAQVVPATLHLGPHARQNSPSATPPTTFPRNNSPSTAPPAAYPRKNSPNAPENSVFRPFWACRANFFALTPTSSRAGRTFSRTGRGNVATM